MRPYHSRLALALAVLLSAGSCTLFKPVTGLVAGPVLAFSAEPRAGGTELLMACPIFLPWNAAVGAVAGLVNGAVSDFNSLAGRALTPSHNWWHPGKTNAGPSKSDASEPRST